MPQEGIGRTVAVRHLPGGGLRPPTGGADRRHAARGGGPQGHVQARVRLRRRLGRLRGERRRQRHRLLPVAGRAPDARRHDRARHVRRALRPSPREPAPRRTGRRAVDGRTTRPTSPSPGARASSASPRSSAPRPRCRWRRSRARWAARATGTSSTGAATTTSSRASSSRAEACGSDALVVTLDTAYLGWRPRDLDLGHLPFARGEGIAQYTSDPVFRRLVAERVAARGRRADDRPRPTPGRGRAPCCRWPQPPGRHPPTTSPRPSRAPRSRRSSTSSAGRR